MEIRKRNGEMAAFDAEKIRAAMRLAFTATNVEITEQSLNSLLRAVLKRLEEVQQLTVENVQDQVEQQLMAEGYGTQCPPHGRRTSLYLPYRPMCLHYYLLLTLRLAAA